MTVRVAGRTRWWLVVALVAGGVLLFAAGNAHLVWVAVRSEPGCVAHVKVGGEGPGYSAAKSSC